MPLGIQQQVIRFDVPMDEAQLVYGVDGERRFRDVKLRALLGQRVLLHQQRHHITAGQELHYKVQVDRILEAVVHLHDPLVVGLDEDVALGAHVRHLFLLEHVGLPQDLHGVDVARVLFLHQPHLAERAPAYHLQRFEVLDAQPRPLQPQEFRFLLRVLQSLLVPLLLGQALIF